MSSPTALLAGLSAPVRADLASYAARAAALDRGGVVRLHRGSGVIAGTVRARAGTGLLGAGTILAVRAMPAPAADAAVDVVVEIAELRRALREGAEPAGIGPSDRRAAWAGLTPPRSGWERLGEYVVGSAPWAAELGGDAGPAAAALSSLGFLAPEAPEVTAYRQRAWTRISARAGHLLLR